MDLTRSYQTRYRFCCGLSSLLVLAVMVLVNLPWQAKVLSTRWMGETSMSDDFSLPESGEAMQRGGWPWTYRIVEVRTRDETIEQSVRFWSTPSLIGDLLVAFVVVLGTWKWTAWRAVRVLVSPDPGRTKMRFDLATASAFFLLPAIILGQAQWTRMSHENFCRQLSRGDRCLMTVEVPDIIADRLPSVIQPLLLRARVVAMSNPNPETVEDLARLSTLRSVTIARMPEGSPCQFDFSPFRELTNISFESCVLSDSQVSSFTQKSGITTLGLNGCRLSDEGYQLLSEMTGLRRIDLRRTNLQMARLGQPRWGETIEQMYLTRPSQRADELTVDGWPALHLLSICSTSIRLNDQPLTVRLRRLPELAVVHLDRMQKHRLVLHELPKLEAIEEPSRDFFNDFTDSMVLYGFTWLERLDIADVPRLKSLSCSTHALTHLQIRGADRLRHVEMGASQMTRQGVTDVPPVAPHKTQQWIDELAMIPSLESIEISSMHMADINLSPLATLPKLQELQLLATSVDAEQLECFADHATLEQLALGECKVSEEIFHRLMTSLPALARLQADLSEVRELSLVRYSHLRTLDTEEFSPGGDVEVRDLPRLSGRLRLSGSPDSLEIINVPRLEELIVTSPWPEQTRLKGLPSLRCFAAGGPGLSSQTVQELLSCDQMDELTLAYATISREQLTQLRTFKNLTGLHVPGCGVDDEIVRAWYHMDRLRSICFDDSEIGVPTLRWLATLPSLRRLSLARNAMTPETLEHLANLTQLADLCLTGCTLTDEFLATVIDGRNLDVLDLSDIPLSPAMWEKLRQGSTLKQLILHGSHVDVSSLRDLLVAQPELRVEVDASVRDCLVNEHRLSPSRLVDLELSRTFSFISSRTRRWSDIHPVKSVASTSVQEHAVMEGFRLAKPL